MRKTGERVIRGHRAPLTISVGATLFWRTRAPFCGERFAISGFGWHATGRPYIGNSSHFTRVMTLTLRGSLTAGNMTTRMEGGQTHTQVFDAENRLVSITVDGDFTEFFYNGDGNLAKKVNPDGSYVLYIGAVMEVEKNSGGTVLHTTIYYPAGVRCAWTTRCIMCWGINWVQRTRCWTIRETKLPRRGITRLVRHGFRRVSCPLIDCSPVSVHRQTWASITSGQDSSILILTGC
jgi:YD repeat-containing protein